MSDLSIEQSKNNNEVTTRSLVVIIIEIHERNDWNIRNGPKVRNDDPNARVMTGNNSVVRSKAENIFSARTTTKIILANFVPYWKPRRYDFHVYFKGLSKNSYDKARYSSRRK